MGTAVAHPVQPPRAALEPVGGVWLGGLGPGGHGGRREVLHAQDLEHAATGQQIHGPAMCWRNVRQARLPTRAANSSKSHLASRVRAVASAAGPPAAAPPGDATHVSRAACREGCQAVKSAPLTEGSTRLRPSQMQAPQAKQQGRPTHLAQHQPHHRGDGVTPLDKISERVECGGPHNLRQGRREGTCVPSDREAQHVLACTQAWHAHSLPMRLAGGAVGANSCLPCKMHRRLLTPSRPPSLPSHLQQLDVRCKTKTVYNISLTPAAA